MQALPGSAQLHSGEEGWLPTWDYPFVSVCTCVSLEFWVSTPYAQQLWLWVLPCVRHCVAAEDIGQGYAWSHDSRDREAGVQV